MLVPIKEKIGEHMLHWVGHVKRSFSMLLKNVSCHLANVLKEDVVSIKDKLRQ